MHSENGNSFIKHRIRNSRPFQPAKTEFYIVSDTKKATLKKCKENHTANREPSINYYKRNHKPVSRQGSQGLKSYNRMHQMSHGNAYTNHYSSTGSVSSQKAGNESDRMPFQRIDNIHQLSMIRFTLLEVWNMPFRQLETSLTMLSL